MKEFEKICGFERLELQEQLLYDALNHYDSKFSVPASWKHYGMLQQEINHMCFIDGLLTESEYDILDSYLFDVIYQDCYNNMMNRMKVRDKDER